MREGRERECLVTNGENKKEKGGGEGEGEGGRGRGRKKEQCFLRRKLFYPSFKVITTQKI